MGQFYTPGSPIGAAAAFVAAVVGIVGFFYFIWDRYRKPKLRIDVEDRDIFFCWLFSDGSAKNGHLALFINGANIYNPGHVPAALKRVELLYRSCKGGCRSSNQHIYPTTIHPGMAVESKSVVITSSDGTNAIIMNWRNFADIRKSETQINPRAGLDC